MRPACIVSLGEESDLTQAEQEALSTFADLAGEYPFGDPWIGKSFVLVPSEGQAMNETRSLAGARVQVVLRNAFDAFSGRFSDIRRRDEPRLRAFGDRLRAVLESGTVRQATSMASVYLQALPQPVAVHLLLSRGRWIVGGANEGPSHVTLAAMERPEISAVVEVLVHEAIHLMEEPVFNPMFMAFCAARSIEDQAEPHKQSPYSLMKEALAGALLSGGCLSPVLGNGVRDWESYADHVENQGSRERATLGRLTGKYLPLVDSYVRNGRPAEGELLLKAESPLPQTPYINI